MEQKVVVITGSSRGIGFGLAREFLRQGHRVVLNGQSSEGLQVTLEKLVDHGDRTFAVLGDVSSVATHEEILSEAVKHFGRIDIWINNAGIPQAHALFHDLLPEDIQKLVDVNITGLMLGSYTALRYFREQGQGRIYNMEGFGSKGRMMKKLTLYGTSKRAVQYFSLSLSRELSGESIGVGVLSPGMVRTDFLDSSSGAIDPDERKRVEKVFRILGEEVEPVCEFLVKGILKGHRKYERINYLNFRRMFPKILRLMFVHK